MKILSVLKTKLWKIPLILFVILMNIHLELIWRFRVFLFLM